MKRVALVSLFFWGLSASTIVIAKTMTAVCSDLKGPETYYLTALVQPDDKYIINKFHDHSTEISDTKLTLIWDQQKNVAELQLSDTRVDNSNNIDSTQIVLLPPPTSILGPTQITFSGILKDAPIMLSIYPDINVAIFSQHSISPPLAGRGIITFMLHAKCNTTFN